MAAEKNFENKVKAYLRTRGAYFVKFFGNAFTRSGVPDLLTCVNGYFVGIELKAKDGRPSDLQLHNIKKIREAGGFAFVLFPSAYERFTRFIEGLDRDEYDREGIPEIWR